MALNTEIAELLDKTGTMFEVAEKVEYKQSLTSEEKDIYEVANAWAKSIGEKGYDDNREIAAFVNKTVTEEIYNAPDELLDTMFDRGTIGEFDDVEYTKTPKNTLEAIEAAKVVGKAKIADKNGKIPSTLKVPLRDGDEERSDDPVYEGMMFINASSTRKPTIVDKELNPIMSQEEFYSGCYGRASINFYAFNVQSKGIAAGLNNLQKLEDGESLVGGSTADEDFGGKNAWDDELM